MEKLIIIGGRGTAMVIAEQIEDAITRFNSKYEILGIALDDLTNGSELNGYPILCAPKDLMENFGDNNEVKFIYSLYRPDVMRERTDILYNYQIPLLKFVNFIHPTVLVAKSVTMGYGNVVLANSVINGNFKMGNFNTINSLCLMGHDSIIGNNNFFAAHVGLGSGVKIGDMNFVGLNTTLRNGIDIGNENIIAMASNVVKNIENKTIVMGNPAVPKDKLNNVIR